MVRIAAAIVLSLVVVAPAHAAKDDLVLVTRIGGANGAAADDGAAGGVLSADGRVAAFYSTSDNLSAEDRDDMRNIYARDLRTDKLTYLNRATGANGAAADGDTGSLPAMSADGRYVAFDSTADNLSTEDDDEVFDVFVRDLRTSTTTLVSRASDGAPGNGNSSLPAISADGRYVAFASSATNLSAEDGDAAVDVFVRDLQTNTTVLVSRGDGPAGPAGDDHSDRPTISADGRSVAFQSLAKNFSDADRDETSDIFVRDLAAKTTEYVSRASGGVGADKNADLALISADGRHVAFSSAADNLTDDDGTGSSDAFVRDLTTGTTTLVSRAPGATGTGGDGDSIAAAISADGRYVGFTSIADNLSGQDNDEFFNAFVRDTRAGTTTFVSRAAGAAGVAADGASFSNGISADGRYVAFMSTANNLSAFDRDGTGDVFVRDVRGGPPVGGKPSPPRDTTPPALLARAHRPIRVTRTGRFTLLCGRFSEPVFGSCAVRRLGRRSFTAAAGRPVRLRYRLSHAGLRALKAAGRRRLRATVVARDAAGNATTVRFRFTLKAPRRARAQA